MAWDRPVRNTGVYRSDDLLYWSKNAFLHNEGFSKTMTVNRYEKLTQYLHCNAERNGGNDPLVKIRDVMDSMSENLTESYRQFGGHKNKENKSSKIEFNFVIVCFGLFWVFIHVRLAIQRIRNFALLDKKLFIYLMQNFRWFTYLMLRGVQRILEEPLNTPVRSGIKYL